jgi:hypothetical protein
MNKPVEQLKEQKMEKLTVPEIIAKILSETEGVGKNHLVGDQKSKASYKARSIEDIINTLRPKFGQYGLCVYPSDVEKHTYTEVRVNSYDKERLVQLTDAKVTLCFTNGHDSIYAVGIGRGEDSGDKAHNKAMTFAYKNVLTQTFMMQTSGDDPDMVHSDDDVAPATRKPALKKIVSKPVDELTELRNGIKDRIFALPENVRADVKNKMIETFSKETIGSLTNDELFVFDPIVKTFEGEK